MTPRVAKSARASRGRRPSPVVLTFLIPCLNEAETLALCIQNAHEGARQAQLEGYEILVADNGSADGSAQVAEREGAAVLHVPVRGYGSALQAGIQAARGRFVLMGDADGSYDFSEAGRFLGRLEEGFQLVVGTRLRGRILPGAMPFLHRYIGNPILTWLGNLLFGVGLSDFHCGLRAFDRQAVRDLQLKTQGMEFASEMIIRAHLAGYRLAEVPITYSPDRRSRPPHLRRWRDGWRHLRFLLLFSPTWLFLLPGLALFVAAAVASLVLLTGPIQAGSVVFDVHTLIVTSTLALVGLQILLTGMLARGFSTRMGLLPPSPRLDKVRELLSLEVGLGLGAAMIVAGVAVILATISFWGSLSFGPLTDIPHSMRMTIAGTFLVVAGIQLFFGSFALSLLDID